MEKLVVALAIGLAVACLVGRIRSALTATARGTCGCGCAGCGAAGGCKPPPGGILPHVTDGAGRNGL